MDHKKLRIWAFSAQWSECFILILLVSSGFNTFVINVPFLQLPEFYWNNVSFLVMLQVSDLQFYLKLRLSPQVLLTD